MITPRQKTQKAEGVVLLRGLLQRGHVGRLQEEERVLRDRVKVVLGDSVESVLRDKLSHQENEQVARVLVRVEPPG